MIVLHVCRVDEAVEGIVEYLRGRGCVDSLSVLRAVHCCSRFICRAALAELVRRGVVRRAPDYSARRMCFEVAR